MLGIPVGRNLLQCRTEELGLLLRTQVNAVVIVTVARELADGLEILDEAGLRVAEPDFPP